MDGVRRPLVVFTPKSMLRAKQVVSPLADFTGGRFRPVIDDPTVPRVRRARRRVREGAAVLRASSTGSWRRRARSAGITDDIAIVRLEQLYPVPDRRLAAVLDRYPNAEDIRWVQEEPAQPGRVAVPGPGPAGEAAAAGRDQAGLAPRAWPRPPPGRRKVHEVEQQALISRALDDDVDADVYATDRGIEELAERRGEEQVSVEWLAERLRVFVDRNPAFEDAVERLASFLARDDED